MYFEGKRNAEIYLLDSFLSIICKRSFYLANSNPK